MGIAVGCISFHYQNVARSRGIRINIIMLCTCSSSNSLQALSRKEFSERNFQRD